MWISDQVVGRFAVAVAMATAMSLAPALSLAQSAVDHLPETKDRRDRDRMDAILKPAIDLIGAGDIEHSKAEFSRILAENAAILTAPKTDQLDLTTTFAVELCESDHPEYSLPYLRSAIDLAKSDFGAVHPETALAYTDLGDCLAKVPGTKHGAERVAAYHQAYSIRRATLGEENPETVVASQNFADAVLGEIPAPTSAEDISTAISLYDASVDRLTKLGPAYEMDLANAVQGRALALLSLGRVEAAEVDMERALVLGSGPYDVGVLFALKACQTFAKQYRLKRPADADKWDANCTAFQRGRFQPLVEKLKKEQVAASNK